MSHPDTDRLAAELSRIEESAMWSAQGQFEQAKQWRLTAMLIGVPASALAAISGVTALTSTSGRVAAGVVALAAAGLGTIVTSLNPANRAAKAATAANAYLEVQTAARQARELDLGVAGPEEMRKAVRLLTERRNAINKTADVINARAYKRARKVLEAGGQAYAVDAEGSAERGVRR